MLNAMLLNTVYMCLPAGSKIRTDSVYVYTRTFWNVSKLINLVRGGGEKTDEHTKLTINRRGFRFNKHIFGHLIKDDCQLLENL